MRLIAGGFAGALGGSALQNAETPWAVGWALLSILSAIGMVAGFLTPISGALAALTSTIHWSLADPSNAIAAPPAPQEWIAALLAIAVAFAGPGAFSADARLFGRREIVIPAAKRGQ